MARALTLLFYERCGVALLDMAYPSNHYTFGAVVEETPMILFRKPNAQHQMFHVDHLHADKSHFQVGTIFPTRRKLHRKLSLLLVAHNVS